MSIKVQQLLKTFGTQRAVDQISFEATPGHITGFLGPNGAGKSTTMKMLTGYIAPTAGQAFICGIDVNKAPQEARKKIGYLPESNALYGDLYIKEYLAYTAGIYALPQSSAAVKWAIEQVGLTPEAHKKIKQLSKGYKQRVGLAAAIIHRPEVLILDEPTSGLDPNQIIEIRQLIKSMSAERTVLLSTHIMQEVSAICDQVIIIHKGQIVANNSLQQLSSLHARPIIKITLAEPLEAAWFSRLPSVEAVEKIDTYTWQLQTHQPAITRNQLMQLALEQQLNISSLSEGGSLEEMFKSLTTGV